MMKQLILLILLFSMSITIGLAQDTQTLTVSESDINNTLDRFLEESERNFDIDVKLSEGQISIIVSSEESNFNYEKIEWTIVPTVQEGRVLWTLATWEATDTDGNPVAQNERIQSFTPSIMNIWGRSLRHIVRGEMSESGFSISDIQVSTGLITVQIDHQLTSASNDELPPNATENADGSFTVEISQDMMNQSLVAIQNRFDAIDSLSVDITENTFNFSVGIERVCDAPLEVQYGFMDSVRTINDSFEIGDWNENGTDELAMRVSSPDDEQSFYTIELVNAFCQGEAVSGQQSERVNSLLLPAVQRFLQLQSYDSELISLEILERKIVLILPHTTCLCNHL